MLGHEPRAWFGGVNWRKMKLQAAQALSRLGIDIDVARPLGNYSVAIQQMVAIARSLEFSAAKVLILDEPTSSLDVNETNQLFEVMRRLKSQGMGIVFITHFLDQVYQVADRITVLRNGRLVGTFETRLPAAHRADRQDAGPQFDRPGRGIQSQRAARKCPPGKMRARRSRAWAAKG